jgi:hypothetical protein
VEGITLTKNRETIEDRIRNGVADLSLNQAAALMVMTSDVRKLFNFARDAEHLSVEASHRDQRPATPIGFAIGTRVWTTHNCDMLRSTVGSGGGFARMSKYAEDKCH